MAHDVSSEGGSGRGAAKSDRGEGPGTRSTGEPITPEGLAALKAEIEELEGPRRRELAARLNAARELGDLSENAEYHIAKDDQAYLETRIKRLRERLGGAVVVESTSTTESF